MNVTELFGSNVFNDEAMKNLLPKEVYKSLRKTIDEGKSLDTNIASVVANAMKDWAKKRDAATPYLSLPASARVHTAFMRRWDIPRMYGDFANIIQPSSADKKYFP